METSIVVSWAGGNLSARIVRRGVKWVMEANSPTGPTPDAWEPIVELDYPMSMLNMLAEQFGWLTK